MTYGPALAVLGPLPEPPRYTLYDSARGNTTDVDNADGDGDRWLNGVNVWPYPCGPAATWDQCAGSGAYVPADQASPGAYVQASYQVVLPIRCTARSVAAALAEWEQMGRDAFKAYEPAAAEREWWTGALLPTNQRLANATGLLGGALLNGGAATASRRALSYLEDAIATGLGGRGWIHCTPGTMTAWAANGYIVEDRDGRLMTRQGNVVVPGSGYPGTLPNGAAPVAGQAAAYATGPVAARRGDVTLPADQIREVLNRGVNTVFLTLQRSYAFWTNGCFRAGVLVDWTT